MLYNLARALLRAEHQRGGRFYADLRGFGFTNTALKRDPYKNLVASCADLAPVRKFQPAARALLIKIYKISCSLREFKQILFAVLHSRSTRILHSIENRAAQLAKVARPLRLNLKARKFSATRCFQKHAKALRFGDNRLYELGKFHPF